VTRGNISARSSSEGWQQRPGGLAEHNLFLRNSAGLLWGHFQAEWPAEAASGVIRNNVVLDARDINTELTRGHGIWFQRCLNVEVYGNILAHQRHGTGAVQGFMANYENSGINLHGNVVYNWTHPAGGNSQAVNWMNDVGGTNSVTDNTFVASNSSFGRMIVHKTALPADITYANNRYFTNRAASSWFEINDASKSFTQWVEETEETGATNTPVSFPDPERDIESYMTSLGGDASLEAFLAQARLQSRHNWRPEYTAKAVVNYMRVGFGMEELE
jgi:hypothetical protein